MTRSVLILALGLAACSEPPADAPANASASVPALAVSSQGEPIATSVVGGAARLVLTRGAAAPAGTAAGWTLATDDAGTIRTRTD